MRRLLGSLALALSFYASVLASPHVNRTDPDPVVYAENFGVVADSLTFNHVQLQAAINAIAASYPEGGKIVLPAGVIRFDTVLVFTGLNGIVLEGQGGMSASLPETRAGTVLYFDPLSSETAPTGITVTNCSGIGFRDIGFLSADGQAGNFITFADTEFCFMENCRVAFNSGEAGGPYAAITLTSLDDGAGCTGNHFYNCFIGALGNAGTAGRAGWGVRANCVGTGGAATTEFVTDNMFVMCKFSNFENAGAAIRIDGLSDCEANNNKFVSCHVGVPADGDRAGVDVNNGDRNHFLACQVDGESADTIVEFDASSESNMLFGSVDGAVSDLQATPSDKLSFFDLGGGGSEKGFLIPWITLHDRTTAPDTTLTGTIWVGARSGTADTLFVYLNGALQRVNITAAP